MKNFNSGKYVKNSHHKSFSPSLINRKWTIDDMDVIQLLSKADRELGKLDMYSKYIPNIGLFISMHVTKEANQSSKIEGTRTNLEEALLPKTEIPFEKRDDWEEVQNYILAMTEAIKQLDKLPFSSRLIKHTHAILMQGVRGETKQPGNFRNSQNWIGGISINDAVFVPPMHDQIQELMADLEQFVHNERDPFPELLKIALVHYQFETIHPFLDGNGRVGRLMISLYLVSKGLLKEPILYLSDFFEKHKNLYYDNLMRAREKGDINRWFKFFLTGIIETATAGIATFDAILQLNTNALARIEKLGRKAGNARILLNHLYQQPFVDAEIVAEVTGLSGPSTYKLLSDMQSIGILNETTGQQRDRRYAFQEYVNIFK